MIMQISIQEHFCVKIPPTIKCEVQRQDIPDVVLATGPGTAWQPPHSDAGQSALRSQVVGRTRQRILHHQLRLRGDGRRLIACYTLVQTAVALLNVRQS